MVEEQRSLFAHRDRYGGDAELGTVISRRAICGVCRKERNEPSAWERTRTAQVVPPSERVMDGDSPVEIEEILATLCQGDDVPDRPSREREWGGGETHGGRDASAGSYKAAARIDESISSALFPVDGTPSVLDAAKLGFAGHAVRGDGDRRQRAARRKHG
ncbi:hypothetical protein PWT90_09252 [Aphanocladium album]|nr:hypothetical protein PWT90_09252 [Aphanocladium album]